MAVLPIITGADNPILRTKTKEVPSMTKDISKLLKDMEDTLVDANGLGIASPQIGKDLRLCLAKLNDKIIPLINPYITHKSEEMQIAEEGCLSLPSVGIDVPRAAAIAIEYLDINGQTQQRELQDLDARIVQHEIDHLDGILIVDYR
jgi:peptide deformylase